MYIGYVISHGHTPIEAYDEFLLCLSDGSKHLSGVRTTVRD